MTCGEAKGGTPKLVKRETQKGPSPPITGLVDSGKGYEKQNVFITAGTPTLLPEFIKNYMGGNLSSQTCVSNKLTATPSV